MRVNLCTICNADCENCIKGKEKIEEFKRLIELDKDNDWLILETREEFYDERSDQFEIAGHHHVVSFNKVIKEVKKK